MEAGGVEYLAVAATSDIAMASWTGSSRAGFSRTV